MNQTSLLIVNIKGKIYSRNLLTNLEHSEENNFQARGLRSGLRFQPAQNPYQNSSHSGGHL